MHRFHEWLQCRYMSWDFAHHMIEIAPRIHEESVACHLPRFPMIVVKVGAVN